MSLTPAAPMSADEARVATERIRLALDQVSTAWADLGERITDAYQRRADLALGYSSWAAYADAELRPSHELSADIRRELVGLLSAQGMSTRAIAPTVGVSNKTISLDRQVLPQVTPAAGTERAGSTIATAEGVVIAQAEHIDLATGEVLGEEPPAPTTITGLDGKTYTRPEPAPTKQRRRPLPDVALDAAQNLTSAVERMVRVFADDRYPQNREQVARDTRNHLNQALEALHRLADELTQ